MAATQTAKVTHVCPSLTFSGQQGYNHGNWLTNICDVIYCKRVLLGGGDGHTPTHTHLVPVTESSAPMPCPMIASTSQTAIKKKASWIQRISIPITQGLSVCPWQRWEGLSVFLSLFSLPLSPSPALCLSLCHSTGALGEWGGILEDDDGKY